MHLLADAATQAAPYNIQLKSWIVMIVAGSVIPLVTAFLTKVNAHSLLKGMITVVLTAVTALIAQATVNDGIAVISKQAVILWFVGLAQAEVAYYAAWKPANAPANLAPTFGLGPAVGRAA